MLFRFFKSSLFTRLDQRLSLPVFNRYLYFFFIILAAHLAWTNSVDLAQDITKVLKIRRYFPPQFPGLKFSGLNAILPGVRFIGYYTDKDMTKIVSSTQYAQAQYVLAPMILVDEYKNIEFVIFDCSTPAAAFQKIKELKLIPVKKNRFGLVVARNPNAPANRYGYKR